MEARGMSRGDFSALWQRLLRVARLDATAFLEVRSDRAATLPAVIVVAVATVLSGLGGWLLYAERVQAAFGNLPPVAQQLSAPYFHPPSSTPFFIRSVIVGSLAQIVMWFVWVAITTLMLQRVWPRRADFAALARTMGLAFFPVSLSLLMVIPALATPIGLIALAAAVLLSGVAVEAATEAEPSEVLFSNLVGFAVFAIVLGLLGRSGNYFAPGLFAFSI